MTDDLKDGEMEMSMEKKQLDQAALLDPNNENVGSGVEGRRNFESTFAGEEGLTTFTAILAMISTIIGGGIVGLPYSFLLLGIPLAMVLNICAVCITIGSGKLYLAMKDLVPDKPESLYELGYMLVGRSSIYIIATICAVNAFGLMLIYFIVFGDTTSQLVANISGNEWETEWFTSRWIYVVGLGALLVPVILQKELAELEWVSFVLFISIGLFMLINFWQLTIDSTFEAPAFDNEMLKPRWGFSLISALSITLVAYSYQQNLFPIYGSLKNKTNEEYVKMSTGGLFLSTGLYLAVALISLFMFGEDLESSVLINIGNAVKPDGTAYWEAYVVQVAFMIVLVCHIPFIFYAGKEGLLIIIDESDRKSISNALWHKLQTNTRFSEVTKNEEAPNPELPIPGDQEGMAFSSMVEDEDPEKRATMKMSALQKSKAIMSQMSVVKAQRLAYKDMNTGYYVGATLVFYFIIVVVSCYIQDISTIFDFASAISISALAFIFPGWFYLKAEQKFRRGEIESPGFHRMSIAYICIGCVNFVLGILSTVIGIVSGEGGE